jgi:ubiquinone/menaquinone biosynthesis C-methylase UbiE
MRVQNKPEFDQYASRYTELHRENIKASGEEPSYFAAYKARYMAAHLPARLQDTSALSILDFGCGVGNSIPHLRQAFPEATLYGADPSSESIELANASLKETATFQVIEQDNLPYPDQHFDLILAACVFHHISPPRRQHWMQQLHRVLKPHGRLFIFEHNILNPLTMKAVRECPFDEDAILLPKHEVLELTKEAGFNDVSKQYIVFFPRALSALRPLEPFLGWIPFGAQYAVHASP